jgi:hypothetical protein
MVLYDTLCRTPLIAAVVLDLRHRVRMIQVDDEHSIRLRTMKYFLVIACTFCAVWIAVLGVNRNVFSVILLLFGTVYIYGFLSDLLIRRLELQLLGELTLLFAHIRRRYHRHQMVYEAIQEAASESPGMARTHALKIADCLASHNPQTTIAEYYEMAPNKYLQALAGVVYLIFEYGDRKVADTSLFQKSLAGLIGEVEIERVRRQRLSFLLQSLQSITILPLLTLAPLERWASDSFPAMSNFYSSGKGFLCEIAIYAVAFLCFVLVRHLQVLEWGGASADHERVSLEKRIFSIRLIKVFVLSWVPLSTERKYEWTRQQLTLIGERATVEMFYVRRFIYAFVAFVLSLIICWLSLHYEIQHVLEPAHDSLSFTPMSEVERQARKQMHMQDRILLRQNDANLDEQTMQRLTLKKKRLIEIRFTFVHFLGCLLFIFIAYMMPLFMLMFRRGMRRFALAREVEQFETLLTILTPMERMNVEQVLEWMLRFSQHFQQPLQKCLLSFGAGGGQALESLKEDVPYEPFRRIAEQLSEAVERIELSVAFDDLSGDREFIREQRKLQFEKNIAAKSAWGRLIGFMPLYAVIFIYLLAPMMFVGMQQMQGYYQQFQTM